MARRSLARAVGVLTAGAALLAGCTPAAVTGHGMIGAPFPAGRLAQLSVDCAAISVPLNYADPRGPSIKLNTYLISGALPPRNTVCPR